MKILFNEPRAALTMKHARLVVNDRVIFVEYRALFFCFAGIPAPFRMVSFSLS